MFAVDALLASPGVLVRDPLVWQWQDDRGAWHTYGYNDCRQIEAAFLAGEGEVSLATGAGRSFVVNLTSRHEIRYLEFSYCVLFVNWVFCIKYFCILYIKFYRVFFLYFQFLYFVYYQGGQRDGSARPAAADLAARRRLHGGRRAGGAEQAGGGAHQDPLPRPAGDL